jgi:hypothetical protein
VRFDSASKAFTHRPSSICTAETRTLGRYSINATQTGIIALKYPQISMALEATVSRTSPLAVFCAMGAPAMDQFMNASPPAPQTVYVESFTSPPLLFAYVVVAFSRDRCG